MDEIDVKRGALQSLLRELESVLVCFSGGVDSSYLWAEALGALGPRAVAFTAVSESMDGDEKEAVVRLGRTLGGRHVLVETHELDDARYATNPVDRCYWCKREVYGVARREAEAQGIEHVVDGFNTDDRVDHRPGRRAARELGVRSPLDELGFGKPDIREAARRIDLPVWDKPALACLASRFPYGTTITPERLGRVARAERRLRALDFHVVRVRFHGTRACVEVGADELSRFDDPELRVRAERELRSCGFETIDIDPQGYRQGSLNER